MVENKKEEFVEIGGGKFKKIADAEVCGKECEVFSRVVGYYRPTRQWHEGKREEFRLRKDFSEEKALKKRFKDEKTGEEPDPERLTGFEKFEKK